jgi:hypothetical protein
MPEPLGISRQSGTDWQRDRRRFVPGLVVVTVYVWCRSRCPAVVPVMTSS